VRRGILVRLGAYLRAHPIVFLALLTPGIPEYLSGSSPLSDVVLNPAWFLLGLGFNLAMYLPGVLLIREAQVRWKKGWGTVLALGAAYAIVEEGIGLSTMFNPMASVFGGVGAYGHAFGVNWVWVPEVMLIHMLFSISVPLLLFGFVFPEFRGRSLISDRGVGYAIALLALDIGVEAEFVSRLTGYWMGDGVLIGALVGVLALCLLAYRLPSGLLHARSLLPSKAPVAFGAVGGTLYLGVILSVSVQEYWAVPALIVALSVPLYCGCFLAWFLRNVGASGNDRQIIAFAFGLITPLIIIGAVSQLAVPFVLVVDALTVLLFVWLYRRTPNPLGARSSTPIGA
jgi:hypothetical protein